MNNSNSGNRQGWAERLRLRAKPAPFRPPKKNKLSLPAVVYEVQSGFVLGARLSRTRRKVSRLAVRDFAPEALAAASCLSPVAKPEELRETVQGLEAALGNGKGSLALLVPDTLVRVCLLEFETLPGDAKDRQALMGWKLKPLLPFALEEARLSFEVAHQEAGRLEVLALAGRSSVLAEYESILESMSGEVKIVLPATLSLLPLLKDDAESAQLLLHIWPGGLTAVVQAAGRIRLWRTQAAQWASPEQCLASASQEASRMLAAVQDRLGLETSRVSLCVRPPVPEEWVAQLCHAMGREAELLTASDSMASGLSAQQSELFRFFGAPLAGLLANAS